VCGSAQCGVAQLRETNSTLCIGQRGAQWQTNTCMFNAENSRGRGGKGLEMKTNKSSRFLCHPFVPRIRKTFAIFTPATSLRRRVLYSFAVVRLVLAPVILLAVYYLFQMGWIVDRIVSVDAPAATLAQQASIQMQEARRAERNYFLLRDTAYVNTNHNLLAEVTHTLTNIRDLEPEEEATTQKVLESTQLYQQQFAVAVAAMGQPGDAPRERIEAVVSNYERELNGVMLKDSHISRAKLVDDLRTQVGSFDAEITKTVETGDPTFRRYSSEIESSSQRVFDLTSGLEERIWQRVQEDHRKAQGLLRRAEWVLSIVSAVVILLSVWITFVLPREIVKPLISLKEAVNDAASGNYQIEFELEGKGEIVDLAKSVRNLISHITQVRQTETGLIALGKDGGQ
jgi:CHASE3 domain sensor protein